MKQMDDRLDEKYSSEDNQYPGEHKKLF